MPRLSAPARRTRQLLLYLALLFLTLLLIGLLQRCPDKNVPHKIQPPHSSGDTLDVGLIYGPASYYIYADTLGGYNYDLLRHISKRQKVPMKFWPIGSLEEGLSRLTSGKLDMIAALPVDAEFKKRYLYTEPVYLDRQVLVQKVGTHGKPEISSALDLASDTVHIEKDSPVAARLHNLAREIGEPIVIVEHTDLSSELLTLMVQRGEIRYAVVNEQIARPLTSRFADLDISSPISFTQFQSIVLAPGDTILRNKLDGWIKEALQTPYVKELKRRYNL